ncbi:nuclear transport factor 2 family protein [Dyadobacter psychrotolerans]|uniref:SnoaL-like domain-containing protein n=1 Tax=Dyadobacter psychrotolerans TaxID=2541721 RepID=A0A4R5DZC3_9BACT|nr:nuclear transport factor 2 family protein [Dyadobacter psychrotolerans]TDE16583.1 hypothetical protein E0F88_10130 [Dyadobacter psychrotolerans]
MNRKISVFILLILLASSFKYRAKTVEADASPVLSKVTKVSASELSSPGDFDAVVNKMQEANRQFSQGNPQLFKLLWSHSEDVTIFDGSSNQQLTGWELVEPRLDLVSEQMQGDNNSYTFAKIASKAGPDMGYLVQTEHYKINSNVIDLRVTTLFRKENGVWKIIHRQADDLGGNRIVKN